MAGRRGAAVVALVVGLLGGSLPLHAALPLPSATDIAPLQHLYRPWHSPQALTASLAAHHATAASCRLTRSPQPPALECEQVAWDGAHLATVSWRDSRISSTSTRLGRGGFDRGSLDRASGRATFTGVRWTLTPAPPRCQGSPVVMEALEMAEQASGELEFKGITWRCGGRTLAQAGGGSWAPETASWTLWRLSFAQSPGHLERLRVEPGGTALSQDGISGFLPPHLGVGFGGESSGGGAMYAPLYVAPLRLGFGPVFGLEPSSQESQGAMGAGVSVFDRLFEERRGRDDLAPHVLHLRTTLPWRGQEDSSWGVGQAGVGDGAFHGALGLQRWGRPQEATGRLLAGVPFQPWQQDRLGVSASSDRHQWHGGLIHTYGGGLDREETRWWSHLATQFAPWPDAPHRLDIPVSYAASPAPLGPRRAASPPASEVPKGWHHRIKASPALLWQWGSRTEAFSLLTLGADVRYSVDTTSSQIQSSSRHAALVDARGHLAFEGRAGTLRHRIRPQAILRAYPAVSGTLKGQELGLSQEEGGYGALRLHQELETGAMRWRLPLTFWSQRQWGGASPGWRHLGWAGLGGRFERGEVAVEGEVNQCVWGRTLCRGAASGRRQVQVSLSVGAWSLGGGQTGLGIPELLILQELEEGASNRVWWGEEATGERVPPSALTHHVHVGWQGPIHQLRAQGFAQQSGEAPLQWGGRVAYDWVWWPHGVRLGVEGALVEADGVGQQVGVRMGWAAR